MSLEKTPEDGGGDATSRQFWCFISYRHADNSAKGREWASWLHQELETFEVPEELVGKSNSRGEPIPARIYPVFRDEEELPAYADLSTAIVSALQRSLNLVVLCSPRACESRFVKEEILHFKSLGRAGRTYGAILWGDPSAEGTDGCLPAPLTRRVDALGNLTEEAELPLLVDFREESGSEGWVDPAARMAALRELGLDESTAASECATRQMRLEAAKLQVIAAVLGLEDRALLEAHQRRLRRRRMARLRGYAIWTGLTLLVLALAGASVQFALDALRKADDSSMNSSQAIEKEETLRKEAERLAAVARKKEVQRQFDDGMDLLRMRRYAEAGGAFAAAAAGDHAAAAHELAKLMMEGRLGAPDPAGALPMLERSVAGGHPPAMATLGKLLAAEDRKPDSKARGITLLSRAVEMGERSARVDLAKAIERSDPPRHLSLVSALAEEGDAEGCWLLARALRERAPRVSAGATTPPWYDWMGKAADKGWTQAQREAGAAAWDGSLGPGISSPTERRKGLARLAEASKSGDTGSAEILRRIYADPANLPADRAETIEYLLTGAKVGVPKAMLTLGVFLGEEAVTMESDKAKEATLWLGRAGNAGLASEAAMAHASLALRLSEGPPVNRKLAQASRDLFLGSIRPERPDPRALTGAARCCLLLGEATEAETLLTRAEALGDHSARWQLAQFLIQRGKDAQRAVQLLRKGMEMGDGNCALMLGDWMMSHASDHGQRTKALEVYLRGSDLGSTACSARAARMLRLGQGATSDPARAASLYRKAAAAGDAASMTELGRLMIAGNYAFGSKAEAHAWLRLAGAAGPSREADREAAQIEAGMSENERLISRRLQAELARPFGRQAAPGDKR